MIGLSLHTSVSKPGGACESLQVKCKSDKFPIILASSWPAAPQINTAPLTTHHYAASISILPLAKTLCCAALPVSSHAAFLRSPLLGHWIRGWSMWGCCRPDRSIWARSLELWPFPFPLFTATSTAVCPTVTTHTQIHACTHRHKYQFTEEGSRGQASAGIRALWLS